jgi:hypothetical protein
MHCKDWEERVALHVGGDLPAAERSAVERHLAECGGCQVLWSGMKESLDLLQGAHAELLPPAAYTAVRGRVLAVLGERRRVWWQWAAGLAAAAAVMLVALAVWSEPRVQPLPQMAMAIPPAPPLAHARGSERSDASQRSHDRKGVVPAGPKPALRQPLLVRLVTDDPNIVIYWIAD